jgi:subtilisin family serine protease
LTFDASSADRAAGRDDAGTSLVQTLGSTRFQLVHVDTGQSVSDALATLDADPNVRLATRDGYSAMTSIPNDPLFGQLWGLQNTGLGIGGFGGALAGDDIHAPAAWDRTVGTPSTVIADLDSGYRFEDPDLGPVAWTNPGEIAGNGIDDDHDGYVDDTRGYDFVGPSSDSPTSDNDPTDDNVISGGHGLHTAGTMGAAGNNGVGITGVAQNVRIMPLRVCANSASNNNDGLCPFSSQIAAINYAGAKGARAANMSLGGTTFNPTVRDAFAHNPGTLYVISAGNDAQNNDPGGTPHYPCAYDPTTSGIAGAVDNIVCVAATDQADGLASFSDYGATSVDLGAPGTETLSTYLASETLFHDDFETSSFSTSWPTSGGSGPFARTNEAPLTSFGMSDSPGVATPVASTVRESTSKTIAIPAGEGSCQLGQTRTIVTNGGFFQYFVLSGGSPVFTSAQITSSGAFHTVPISGLGGTNVQVRFRFSSGSSPASGDGAWLDDIDFTCNKPVGTPLAYKLLEGTSMAAPHVTGAAGLLFSLNPSASVADVRSALLATVDPVASLAGRTTSGGRLDVARALDEIAVPDTKITSAPSSSTKSKTAAFGFVRSDSASGGSFECQLDGGAFAACANPKTYTVGAGTHTFAVRARSPHGLEVDASPATAKWTVLQCKVPKLKGLTLSKATKALKKANCKLGKVTKPKARKHHRLPPLVVSVSNPKAGKVLAADAKVKLSLGPKPKPHKQAKKKQHGR